MFVSFKPKWNKRFKKKYEPNEFSNHMITNIADKPRQLASKTKQLFSK